MLCTKYIVKIPVDLKLIKYAHSKGQTDDRYDDIYIASKEKASDVGVFSHETKQKRTI